MSWKKVLAVTTIGIAYVANYIHQRSWFTIDPLQPEKFRHRSNYKLIDIPTTYYHFGKIGDVLQKWHDGPGSYFHLYRLYPNETFDFDYLSLDSNTQVTLMSECENGESTICPPCYKYQVQETVHLSEILNTSSSNMYSSFAKLENVPSVQKLFDAMKFKGIDFKKDVANDHAFVSNFASDRLTAQAHANALSSSLAVQFVGSKVWLFFPPKVFRGWNFLNSYAGAAIVVPTQSPEEDYEVYRYVSQPGDVLFFGENWGHIVLTKKGPNIMMNFRKVEIGNILRQPLDYFHGFLNFVMYPSRAKKGRKSTPYTKIMDAILMKTATLCNGNQRSDWDEEMLKLIYFRE